jgi:hypothetical protein
LEVFSLKKGQKFLSRPVTLALASVMSLGVITPLLTINSHAEAININTLKIGDVILFGGENYVVANPETGLIIKETPLMTKEFSTSVDSYLYSPMVTGNIGNYLNSTFVQSIPLEERSKIATHQWSTGLYTRIGLPTYSDAQSSPIIAGILDNTWSSTNPDSIDFGVTKPVLLNGSSYEFKEVSYMGNVQPAIYLRPGSTVELVKSYQAPTKTPEQTTKVIGTFEATTLDVVIPATSSFIFNPNLNRIDAQPFTIYNQTNAPVYAKMKEISVSPESTWIPSLVEPTKYNAEGWNNLTHSQTQAEVALGLVANESGNWLTGILRNDIWSTEIGEGQKIGVIKTDSPVLVKPTVQSGTALNMEGIITANYVFEFGLE